MDFGEILQKIQFYAVLATLCVLTMHGLWKIVRGLDWRRRSKKSRRKEKEG